MHTNNQYILKRKKKSPTANIQIKQKLIIYLDVIIRNYFETSKLHFITVIAIFKLNLSLIHTITESASIINI